MCWKCFVDVTLNLNCYVDYIYLQEWTVPWEKLGITQKFKIFDYICSKR